MVSRRKFLKKSGLVTGSIVTGSILFPACNGSPSSSPSDGKMGCNFIQSGMPWKKIRKNHWRELRNWDTRKWNQLPIPEQENFME